MHESILNIEGVSFRVIETSDLAYDGQADCRDAVLWLRRGLEEPCRSAVLLAIQAEAAVVLKKRSLLVELPDQ